MLRVLFSLSLVLVVAPAAAAESLDVAKYRLVDLSHAYDENTVYWPAKPPAGFELKQLHYGETPGGWFYASNSLCTAEHGGTHLDAPVHFARGMATTDQVPIERLVGVGTAMADDRCGSRQVAIWDREQFGELRMTCG